MRIKIEPDKNKAGSIKKMAEITLERLNKTEKKIIPAIHL